MSLTDFRPMMERCSMCLSCRWIPFDKVQSARFGQNCPSIGYYNFNTYSARGRFQLSQSILDGRTPIDETTQKVIHSCTGCGACDSACKVTRYNLEPLDHNMELKAYAVENGGVLPVQKDMMSSLSQEKTLIPGAKKADRMKWAEGLDMINVLKEDADILFFAGCKYSYDKKMHESARKIVKLLQRAGIRVGSLGNADCCCAGRAMQMGFKEDFNRIADNNIKIINKARANVVVTPCADCLEAFRKQYAARGSDLKVLHITEYIEKLIADGRISLEKVPAMKVTYHDPCRLGRQGEPYEHWEGHEKKILNQIHTWEPRRPRRTGAEGIYDAPRNIINAIAGVQLVEMERIREYSWCCGAGGGCSETMTEYSQWVASERLSEAMSTGAEYLVTACPWCRANLEKAAADSGMPIKILDIIDLIDMAL